MKYLVVSENVLCTQLSQYLINEIERFDIRSKVEYGSGNISAQLKSFVPDLLILVGTTRSSKVLNKARKTGVKTCFFHQTLLETKASIRPMFHGWIYPDIPVNKSMTEHVFLLSDLVRKHNKNDLTESDSTVTVFYSSRRKESFAEKLCHSLEINMSDVSFNTLDISKNIEKGIDAASQSNAAIALDQFSNVFSAYTNCPVVNVYHNRFLQKSSNEVSIINELLNAKVVNNIPGGRIALICSEVNKVLNDHQYCAGIMQGYQELKSHIGTQPFSRQIAQEIVDSLEAD